MSHTIYMLFVELQIRLFINNFGIKFFSFLHIKSKMIIYHNEILTKNSLICFCVLTNNLQLSIFVLRVIFFFTIIILASSNSIKTNSKLINSKKLRTFKSQPIFTGSYENKSGEQVLKNP